MVDFNRFLNLIVPVNHVAGLEFNKDLLEYAENKIQPNLQLKVLLMRVIDKEISLLSQLNEHKTEFLFQIGDRQADIFRFIDTANSGILEPGNLFKFIKKHDRRAEESLLLAIFRRIKSRVQGTISKSEFLAFLNRTQGQASAYSTINTKGIRSPEPTSQISRYQLESRQTNPKEDISKPVSHRGDFAATERPKSNTDRGRDLSQKSLSQRRSKLEQLNEGPLQRRASRGGPMSFRGVQPSQFQRDGLQLSSSRTRVAPGSSLNQRLLLSRLSPKTSNNPSRSVSRRNSRGREGESSRPMTSRSRLTEVDTRKTINTQGASLTRLQAQENTSSRLLKYSEAISVKPKQRSPGMVDPSLTRDGSRGVIRVSSQRVLSGSHSRGSSIQNNPKLEENQETSFQKRISTPRTLPVRGYTPSTYQLDDSHTVLPEANRTVRRDNSPDAQSLLSARRKEHKQNNMQSTPQSHLTEELLQFPVGRLGKEASTQRTSVVDDLAPPERRSPSLQELSYRPVQQQRLNRVKLDEEFDRKYSQISKSMNDQMYKTLGNSGVEQYDKSGVTQVAIEPRKDNLPQNTSESILKPPEVGFRNQGLHRDYPRQPDSKASRSRPRQEYDLANTSKPLRLEHQDDRRAIAQDLPDSILPKPAQANTASSRQVPNLDKRLQEEGLPQLNTSQLSPEDQEHYTLRRQSSSPDDSRFSDRAAESDWLHDKADRERNIERGEGNIKRNESQRGRRQLEVVTLSGRLPFSSSLFDDEGTIPPRNGYQVPGVDKIGLKLHSSNGAENPINTDRQTSEAHSGPVDSLHGEVDPLRWRSREENPYKIPSEIIKSTPQQPQQKPRLPSEPVVKYQDPFQFASLDDPQAAVQGQSTFRPNKSELSDGFIPEKNPEASNQTLVRSSFQPRYDAGFGDSLGSSKFEPSITSQSRRTDTKPKLQPVIQREYTFSDNKELLGGEFDFRKKDRLEQQTLPDLSGNKMMTSSFNEASNQDLDGFVQVLKKILLYSERIEELKNNIFRTQNFSLLQHFAAFDFEEKGFLTFNEFSQMCNSFKISLSRDDLLLYLQRMLKSTILTTDAAISQESLAVCFSPIDTHGRPIKLRNSQTDTKDTDKRVSGFVEVPYIISKQLQQVVQLQRKLHDEIMKGLKSVNFFARKSVFNLIVHGTTTTPEKPHSESQTGSSIVGITWEDLKGLLETHQIEFYEEDLNFIFLEFQVVKHRFISLTEYLNFFRVYGAKA